MADIVAEKKMIQQEETKPQAAVTESVMSRVGAGINFINTKHLYVKEYCVNGKYNIVNPNLFLDGFFTYPFNFEIVDIVVVIGEATGSSGLSEIDLKWKPFSSGTYQSIFTTTPKWDATAVAGTGTKIGAPTTGFTAPVLSKTLFDAYDLIKLDQLQALVGNVNSYFITIYTKPRN